MKPWNIVAIFLFCLFTSRFAFADDDNLTAAIGELSQQYETCRAQVQQDNQLISQLRENIDTLNQSRDQLQQLIDQYEQMKEVSNSLNQKYQLIIEHSNQIEQLYGDSQTLCEQSVAELKEAITELNKQYNDAVRHCLRPWYLRWSFWSGLAIGAAFSLL